MKPKVLLVIRKMTDGEKIKRFLTCQGYAVDLVHCGLDAIKKIQKFDVMITELRLDEIGGIALCKIAKKHACKAIAINNGPTILTEIARESGIETVIVKSNERNSFFENIATLSF